MVVHDPAKAGLDLNAAVRISDMLGDDLEAWPCPNSSRADETPPSATWRPSISD